MRESRARARELASLEAGASSGAEPAGAGRTRDGEAAAQHAAAMAASRSLAGNVAIRGMPVARLRRTGAGLVRRFDASGQCVEERPLHDDVRCLDHQGSLSRTLQGPWFRFQRPVSEQRLQAPVAQTASQPGQGRAFPSASAPSSPASSPPRPSGWDTRQASGNIDDRDRSGSPLTNSSPPPPYSE